MNLTPDNPLWAGAMQSLAGQVRTAINSMLVGAYAHSLGPDRTVSSLRTSSVANVRRTLRSMDRWERRVALQLLRRDVQVFRRDEGIPPRWQDYVSRCTQLADARKVTHEERLERLAHP